MIKRSFDKISSIFFSLIVLFSAATTATFFAQHFDMFPNWSQFWNATAGATMGLVALDVGSFVWLGNYLWASQTEEEKSVSGLMFMVSIMGSLLTTAAQMASATSFISVPENTGMIIAIAASAILCADFGVVAYITYSRESGEFEPLPIVQKLAPRLEIEEAQRPLLPTPAQPEQPEVMAAQPLAEPMPTTRPTSPQPPRK